MGTLFVVATPIGNLQDITLRALEVLRQVNWIAAEDTRRTRVLLDHYGITTPLIAYHEHNKARRTQELLQRLAQGEQGALVSDAGTPLIHDPGYELVQACLQAGHRVVALPGPSAVLAALVVSGLPPTPFLFLGYLPRKRPARQKLLSQVASLPYTLVFFEAPHRLMEALEDLVQVLGRDRRVALARELTKIHEEVFRGTLHQALDHYRQHPPRGEFTLVVEGAPSRPWTDAELDAAIREGLAQGHPPSQLARELAQLSGLPRGEVYRRILHAMKKS